MYSPKIKEEFIPALYRLAKARGIPMTHIVREALAAYLNKPAIVSTKDKKDNNKRGSEECQKESPQQKGHA